MAFNLSKADQSASSNSKGKFNLSKTEVAEGGDSNSDSNEPKKSKLGLILLILAIGVGAWFFFSKNSAKNDLVEKSETIVNADSNNANLPNSNKSSAVGDNSLQDQKTPDIKASATTSGSDKDNSGNSATAASTEPSSSVKATDAKATAASAASTSRKPSSSAKVTETKATAASNASTSRKPSSSAKATEAKATTASNAATSKKARFNRNSTSRVNFKNGSAELLDINDLKTSSILDKLKSNPNLEITVEGYASSEGDLEFNKSLSQKRADKYSSYLVSQGVPKNSIKSIGKGIDNPIASNDTEEGRAQNRRVEVIIK